MACKLCSKYYYSKKVYDSGLVWVYLSGDSFVFVLKEHSDSFSTCSGAHTVRHIYETKLRPDAKHRKRLQQVILDGHLAIIESDQDTLSC